MSGGPQATWLPDGKRLHLHHGPIDLVLGVDGADRERCFSQALQYFDGVLSGLAAELSQLRAPLSDHVFSCEIARAMAAAVRPHAGVFVTPMAAVAGAVADAVLAAMICGQDVSRAYVNNGGDIAFHLAQGADFTALSPAGPLQLCRSGGVATSGWEGRSYSLGIAEAVTVVADTAAQADVAATLIANAVDLPGHPAVKRVPAQDLSPESDLGGRLVTVAVGDLSGAEISRALQHGLAVARDMAGRGLIADAALSLQGHVVTLTEEGERLSA